MIRLMGRPSESQAAPKAALPLLSRATGSVHSLFLRLSNLADRRLGPENNFLAHTGALANFFFLIALVTGILLLFWYRPSLHAAHASMLAMEADPWLSGFIRTLHRYSSDACMIFVILHALEALVAGRFDKPRRLAWVTGFLITLFLWLEGWLGYWLVWDEPARLVAVVSARALDYLPVFADPIARSFLVPEALNSLFFFVVFFIHMLIPLAFGIGLWLHIAKLNRASFLPGKALGIASLAAVSMLSLALPARAGAAADLLNMAPVVNLDLFYLLPLRFSQWMGPWTWVTLVLVLVLLMALPFLRRNRVVKPHVIAERCNACTQCYEDCPYNAITMTTDSQGRVKALINEMDCMSCGACVGSCNSKGIDFPGYSPDIAHKRIREWYSDGSPALPLAFVCDKASGGKLHIDGSEGFSPQLPGYRVIGMPCTSWLNPLMAEFAGRSGTPGILVGGCGTLSPSYRQGTQLTEERLSGKREPMLRPEKLGKTPLRYLHFSSMEWKSFLADAHRFRSELPASGLSIPSKEEASRNKNLFGPILAGMLLFVLLYAAIRAGEGRNFVAGDPQATEMVISLKHGGRFVESAPSPAELSSEGDLLPHMRGAASGGKRERYPVRIRVMMDGKTVLEKSYPAGGLFKDGVSVAMETFPLDPGTYRMEVRITDGPENDGWRFTQEQSVVFEAGRRRVLFFESDGGFRWY